MKRSSQLPILIAGLSGVLLIALGLFLSQGGSVATPSEAVEPGGDSLPPPHPDPKDEGLSLPKRASQSKSLQIPTPEKGMGIAGPGPASVALQVMHARDNTPAAHAKVSLWREQTGIGAAFRPARRVSQTETDEEGRATLTASPHQPLEVYAQAAGAGPLTRLRLGSMEPDETRSIRIEVERPPAPIDLTVRAVESGEAVSGAAIRAVMIGQENLGLEEFPGTAKLIQRTDGQGHASLPGPIRYRKWLLVDAAGYSPTAIDLRMLDGIGAPEVLLVRAARIDALVSNAAGEPLVDIEIQLVAQLGGFRSTFTAVTNRRGEATFASVPASVPMVPHVGAVGELPTLLDAITLAPGENRQLELSL